MLCSTAIEDVRARLQELVPDFWTAAEVLRAINEGVNRFSQEEKWPWLYTIRSGVTLPASTATLELETGVAYERHFSLLMTFSGEDRPRMPRRIHPVELNELRKRFYTEASEPMTYAIAAEAQSGANEAQTITNAGTTVGTFTITFDGQTTGAIARGASAATIEAALKALSNIGPADVRCTGGPLGTDAVTVTFEQNLAGTNVPEMTLGGTTTNMTVATVVAGATGSAQYVSTVRFCPVLNREATIEYQYIRDAVEVVDGTDTLDIPEEYVMGALAYATGHLFLKELNTSSKGGEQFDLYRKSVDQAKLQLRKLHMDGGFAWGRNEPEMQYVTTEEYVELVTPPLLGP